MVGFPKFGHILLCTPTGYHYVRKSQTVMYTYCKDGNRREHIGVRHRKVGSIDRVIWNTTSLPGLNLFAVVQYSESSEWHYSVYTQLKHWLTCMAFTVDSSIAKLLKAQLHCKHFLLHYCQSKVVWELSSTTRACIDTPKVRDLTTWNNITWPHNYISYKEWWSMHLHTLTLSNNT